MTPACKVCESPTRAFGSQRVLGAFDAEYRQCEVCGYVFVIDPHWLEQAYSTAIAALDTGIVTRNLWLADASCALLGLQLRGVRRSLDFGGGTGLLVRLMRDRGHDFHWRDAYSPNLLARGFEAAPGDSFDLLTAFELVEHLPEPMSVFEQFRDMAPNLLISTELLPAGARTVDDWWYYAPESGQHIGFFTRASLEVIAERLRLKLSSNGRNLHVLSTQRVSEHLLRALRKPGRARWLAWPGIGKSLAHADAGLLQRRLRAAAAGEPDGDQ